MTTFLTNRLFSQAASPLLLALLIVSLMTCHLQSDVRPYHGNTTSNHFCDSLYGRTNDSESELFLEGLISEGGMLYLIESGRGMAIPEANFKTGISRLFLYQSPSHPLSSVVFGDNWVVRDRFFQQVGIIYQNYGKKKGWLSVHNGPVLLMAARLNVHYSVYHFVHDENTYVVSNAIGNNTEEANTSGACHSAQVLVDLRALTDSSGTNTYLFQWNDFTASKEKRRVCLVQLPQVADQQECPVFEKKPSKCAYLLSNQMRTSFRIVPGQVDNSDSNEGDFIIGQLPFGFILDRKVYLVSSPLKRVYSFEYVNLKQVFDSGMASVDIVVTSMSWINFFGCQPRHYRVGANYHGILSPTNDDGQEPDTGELQQEAYAKEAVLAFDPLDKFGPNGSRSSLRNWLLPFGLLICIGIVFAVFFLAAMWDMKSVTKYRGAKWRNNRNRISSDSSCSSSMGKSFATYSNPTDRFLPPSSKKRFSSPKTNPREKTAKVSRVNATICKTRKITGTSYSRKKPKQKRHGSLNGKKKKVP